MSWRVFAASARGSAHAGNGQPCQDASAHAVHGELLVGVVCDGAGSAAASDIGAQRIAQGMVQALVERAGELPAHGDHSGFATWIGDLLAMQRAALEAHATATGRALADFAATVVGVVAWPDGGWFFHLGDGAGVARHADSRTLSSPENGEYANETFFLTGSTWRDHLRITPIAAPMRSVLLMTDGAMPFALAKGGQDVYTPFADPVERFLAGAEENAGNAALHATLDDPRTYRITGDDKTLLVALRA
jgi:hypothetical protein